MSVATATERRYTVEEFAGLPLEGRWELVDGIPVEKQTMGNRANVVSGNVFLILHNQMQAKGQGAVVYDCWLQFVVGKRSFLRRPDVAFFAQGTLPAGPIEDVLKVMPTLAVESISDANTVGEIDAKIDEYLAAGVALVWVLNPITRTLRIHKPDGTIHQSRDHERFADEPLLPGLAFGVAELFAVPGQATGV